MLTRFCAAWVILFSGAAFAVANTLHVPQDQATIQGALHAAAAGDTVLVAPGTYRERLRLKAGVILKSSGDDAQGKLGLRRAEATVLDGGGNEGTGPGVEMAEGATLDGFTITNVGEYNDAEWNRHQRTQGNEQPHEPIGQPGTAGIAATGVSGTVCNNIVHHVGYTGIALTGVAGKRTAPWVRNNICYRNMGGGIGSMGGSQAVIEGNVCFQNFYAGIGHEGASPLVLNNVCYENIRAGIGVSEGACPIVRGNKCHHNRRAGIGVRTGADTKPVIEDNECFENDMAGIGCDEASAPIVRNNRCYKNALAGIGCRDQARPIIFGNKCYENKASGIGSEDSARPLIVENECLANASSGIGQRGNAHTTLIGNYVHENRASGVGFQECQAGKANLLDNRILDNALVAVGIQAGWQVRMIGNELSRTDGLPPIVMVEQKSSADLIANVIRGSGVAGIRTDANVRAIDNTFECPALRENGPPQFAVWGLPGAEISFLANTVRGWRSAVVAEKAAVLATDNRVTNYGALAIKVDQPARVVVAAENVFESARDKQGISVTGGNAVLNNNRITPPAKASTN